MTQTNDKKPLEGLAKAADHIVGDIVLGTIGRVAFHTCQIPVVGTGLKYIGNNLGDGWKAAEQSSLRKRLASAIVDATNKAGKPISSETLASMAKDFGVPESSLDEVKRLVDEATKKAEPKAKTGAFPTPAGAAA